MIDVHCHLNFHAFENDTDEVIKRATQAGVTKIINTGTQVSSSKQAIELAEKYENLFAIIGIHPHHADKVEQSEVIQPSHPDGPKGAEGSHTTKKMPQEILRAAQNDNWLVQLENLAQHPKVIGIGECGLDYYQYKSNGIVDPKLQKEIFIKQIELAHKTNLPLQIHSRDEQARVETLQILQDHKQLLMSVPGMFHCMAGSKESLQAALDLGFYIGFDGNITYEGIPPGEPVGLIELVKATPLDRIVIETDSPYLTPKPHRGQRNEPAYAIITAQFIADLKHVSLEKLMEQTDKNVYTVFGI